VVEEEVYSDLGESINEDENIVLEEIAVEEKLHSQEEMLLEEIDMEEQEEIIDYLDMQVLIILSDEDVKAIWEKYKHYVDETVFFVLQDTILCR
jgi:hypothetical protein